MLSSHVPMNASMPPSLYPHTFWCLQFLVCCGMAYQSTTLILNWRLNKNGKIEWKLMNKRILAQSIRLPPPLSGLNLGSRISKTWIFWNYDFQKIRIYCICSEYFPSNIFANLSSGVTVYHFVIWDTSESRRFSWNLSASVLSL